MQMCERECAKARQPELQDLEDLLLAQGGTVVNLREDLSLEALMVRGRFFKRQRHRVVLVPGAVGQCHKNSARYWEKYPENRIVTGYALYEKTGTWDQHSWLMSPHGEILETTPLRRDLYFGMVLADGEVGFFRRQQLGR